MAVLLALPAVAHAWNYAGHRVIASIAFRQLDEGTRARVAEALKAHPAYERLWKTRDASRPSATRRRTDASDVLKISLTWA